MHSLGGVALLLWNTIQQAKAAGYESLDLGRSDIDNEGLASFKENWGGMRSDISYWRYPHRPRQDSRHNAVNQRILGRLVQAAPDRMLVAAGNLLYRHIG
jgi:lipid II:glycine glycyltransferase (peptidoglycan interpeptide bridge formation enzyme)